MSELFPRSVEPVVREAMEAMRAVLIGGPRQSGKTTLMRNYLTEFGGTFVSLDEQETLNAALADPVTFVNSGRRPFGIDEVQRGGDPLVRAIKLAVDDCRDPGQFLLSGSAQFLTIPTLSESLAGRVGLLDLWPLSAAEQLAGGTGFYDLVFDAPERLTGTESDYSRNDYIDLVVAGGYPELANFDVDSRARNMWYTGYLTTVTERDIGDFSEIGQPATVRKVLALVAARMGGLLVQNDFARELEVTRQTIHNYLRYLEMVYLVTRVPAWSPNLSARVTKTPRVYPTDSGLAASLVNAGAAALRDPGHPALGGLVETFVLAELSKAKALATTPFEIGHYRDTDHREVDFVLERPDGRVVGIEVKASVSPPSGSERHLRWLRQKMGERFTGVLLHWGHRCASLGDGIWSVPMSALWTTA